MRKILIVLLCSLLAISFASCTSEEDALQEPTLEGEVQEPSLEEIGEEFLNIFDEAMETLEELLDEAVRVEATAEIKAAILSVSGTASDSALEAVEQCTEYVKILLPHSMSGEELKNAIDAMDNSEEVLQIEIPNSEQEIINIISTLSTKQLPLVDRNKILKIKDKQRTILKDLLTLTVDLENDIE